MTKTVALSDAAYDALARLKKPGESFSDVVQKLVSERRPRLADVLATLEKPDAETAAHWARFQKERQKARRRQLSRVDLDG